MGILNATPDSFSDGGRHGGSADSAAEEALRMIGDGADVIDVGGESTRPGAVFVSGEEEIRRTVPVIERIRRVSDVPISIDTRRSAVARAAIEAGADIVNDVSGGTHDPDMLPAVAEMRVPVILMHMRGTPKTMQTMTEYHDVVGEVAESLKERSQAAEAAGIPRWAQVLDPGIGFAKDLEGNLSLLKASGPGGRLRDIVGDVPLLLGPSRKGFIGRIVKEDRAEERDFGSVAACLAGIYQHNLIGGRGDGGCTILRVHNVRGVRQAAMIADAIQGAR